MDARQTIADTEVPTMGAPPADTDLTSQTPRPNRAAIGATSTPILALRAPESIEAQSSVSERTSLFSPSDRGHESTIFEGEYGQNSRGYTFAGGQFNSVADDFTLNEHHDDQLPEPGLAGISPISIVDEALKVDIYCSQLRRQKRGLPLYVPQPQEALPEAYSRGGITIGDVGTLTPEGSFEFFFNIFLPANDPIHNNDVPENFCPLPPYEPRDVYHQLYHAGSYVATSSVQMQDFEYVSLNQIEACLTSCSRGGNFIFKCRAPHGAVLVLPDGSRLQRLRNLAPLRRYVTTHARSWFRYINGRRGRVLDGPLYLVTGWEKAPSWGMASFRDVDDSFDLAFTAVAGPGATAIRYGWRGDPAQKKSYYPATLIDAPWNQTMFIHGLTISLGTGFWAWLFGTVQIGNIVDMGFPLESAGGSPMSYVHGSALLSWIPGLFRGRAVTV